MHDVKKLTKLIGNSIYKTLILKSNFFIVLRVVKETDVRKIMYLLFFNYIRCKTGYNIVEL